MEKIFSIDMIPDMILTQSQSSKYATKELQAVFPVSLCHQIYSKAYLPSVATIRSGFL